MENHIFLKVYDNYSYQKVAALFIQNIEDGRRKTASFEDFGYHGKPLKYLPGEIFCDNVLKIT